MSNNTTGEGGRTATLEQHVCDQGHYGLSWCGACGHDLSTLATIPERCPMCKAKLVLGEPTYNQGGSDFE